MIRTGVRWTDCYGRECQVTGIDGDVIPLHRPSPSPVQRGTIKDPAITLPWLRSAAKQLDELRLCAERVALDPQWSAMEWRATCTPLLIRLPGTRQLLASLSLIRVGHWPETEWAVRIRCAHS
jgi:hypothetical protein